MLEIMDNISSILNSNIIEHEVLNSNCLYLKSIENNMIQIKAGYYANPLTNRVQIDEIYTYPAMDEEIYEIEITEFGIAVYKVEFEERKMVALYDAKNNQRITNLSSPEYNQFIMYYNNLEGIKHLQKKMKEEG